MEEEPQKLGAGKAGSPHTDSPLPAFCFVGPSSRRERAVHEWAQKAGHARPAALPSHQLRVINHEVRRAGG